MSLNWPSIWIVGFTLLCLGLLFRPRHFPLVILPALMWQLAIPFGIALNAPKILYGFLFLVLFLHQLKGGDLDSPSLRERRNRQLAKVGFLIYFACLTSVIFSLFPPPESMLVELAPSKWQRPPWRGIVHTVLWCVQILPLFAAARWVRTPRGIAKCIRVFLTVMLITAGVGALQWVGYYFFPPLQRALRFLSADRLHGAAVYAGSEGLLSYRPSPFVGEPRQFGFAMAVSAMVVLLCNLLDIPDIPRWMKSSLLFFAFFVLFIFSGSASAILASIPAFAVLFLWLIAQDATEKNRIKRLFRVIILILACVLVVNWIQTNFSYFERVMVYIRQIAHIDLSRGTFRIDPQFSGSRAAYTGYLAWLREEPRYLLIGAGIGNGAFHAYQYLPPSNPFSELNFSTARVGIIDLLSDIGLIGLLLMTFVWISWWRDLSHLCRYLGGTRAAMVQVSLCMVLALSVYSLVYDSLPVIWFFFGTAFGCAYGVGRVPSGSVHRPSYSTGRRGWGRSMPVEGPSL